jgi:hypothetical protein
MRAVVVIPTYWSRPSTEGWREGDAVFDHPTPLDQQGTLARCIESMSVLARKDFPLLVLVIPTTPDIAPAAEQKVDRLVKSAVQKGGVRTVVVGPSILSRVYQLLLEQPGITEEHLKPIRLPGYSNVRNLCVLGALLLGADVAVLIDDDEVFEDHAFMDRALEFVGTKYQGSEVLAVAGYYLQPDGDYLIKKKQNAWMKAWGQYDAMNRAFEQTIGRPPRLKPTTFVFGGNMVIHRKLFTMVPFDPNVTRGEDIDFLMNCIMYGYTFYLDNRLSIKHLPPPKAHPAWRQLREDIIRFMYQREKLRSQKEVPGMTKLLSEQLDPYPGRFLKDDLEQIVEQTCRLMAEEYRRAGDDAAASQAERNMEIARTSAIPHPDPFEYLRTLTRAWRELMQAAAQDEVVSRFGEMISPVD